MPLFEQAKIVLLPYCTRTTYDGTTTDLVQDFIEQEYSAFPVLQHDDMLDALSRICDEKELQLRWSQTYLQRVQRQANLPGSYHLPTDGNGTPMSHVERHRAIMAGRRTGGHRQPRARPQEKRHLGQAKVEMTPRIAMRPITRSNKCRALSRLGTPPMC